ncbi:MAG TPA: hypothetical protein VEC99_10285, partial [Clostridia bacterium]|nr:hypothetical protein [Clostridia bacterium]
RPVPIPNTAVKHSLANGSGFIDSARVGCRQFFSKKPKRKFRLFCWFDLDRQLLTCRMVSITTTFQAQLPDFYVLEGWCFRKP